LIFCDSTFRILFCARRSCQIRKPRRPRNRTVNAESYQSTKRNRLRTARQIKRHAKRGSRRDDKLLKNGDERCAPTHRTPIIPSRSSLPKRNDKLYVEFEFDRVIQSLDQLRLLRNISVCKRQFKHERKKKERMSSYMRRQRNQLW